MMHLSAYIASLAGTPSTNADLQAITDTVLAVRNSHIIFTDPFQLFLAYAAGDTLKEMRLNAPTLNAYCRHQIWPIEQTGATPAQASDRPALVNYMSSPIVLPQNEEIAWEVTNGAAGAEVTAMLMWLMTPDHQWGIPGGIQRIVARATYSIVATANVWSGAQTITFEQTLRGGWYSVVGLAVEDPHSIAARLVFPRAKQYVGRVLRPGCLVQSSFANRPAPEFMGRIGPYGKFHSFEPAQIEILAVTTATQAGDIRLDMVYHGDTEPTAY